MHGGALAQNPPTQPSEHSHWLSTQVPCELHSLSAVQLPSQAPSPTRHAAVRSPVSVGLLSKNAAVSLHSAPPPAEATLTANSLSAQLPVQVVHDPWQSTMGVHA